MRILCLVNHCNHGHGNAHVAVDIACEQARRGHNVVYASAGGDYEALLASHGVVHERVVQNQRNPIRLARELGRLASICWSFKPDVIHAHMMAGAVFGRVTSSLFHIPLITTVHNSFDRHSFLMRLGDVVVAVSNAERDLLAARGYNSARVMVVVNGPNASPRAGYSPSENAPQIMPRSVITVCGLHARKGVYDLLRGFVKPSTVHPDWRLYVVGDGPDKAKLMDLARELGLSEKVTFLGSVARPADCLSKADIFVLASYAEPCSLAIAEARAAGCAILATAVGGTSELLEGGQAGILVEPGRPDQIAGGLDLLMSDPKALQEWRLKSKRGAEYYRVARVVDEYDQVYKSTLRGTSGGAAVRAHLR